MTHQRPRVQQLPINPLNTLHPIQRAPSAASGNVRLVDDFCCWQSPLGAGIAGSVLIIFRSWDSGELFWWPAAIG
jgi:hypothetical protein